MDKKSKCVEIEARIDEERWWKNKENGQWGLSRMLKDIIHPVLHNSTNLRKKSYRFQIKEKCLIYVPLSCKMLLQYEFYQPRS